MTNTKKEIFNAFLSFFPVIALPVTLTEESQIEFAKFNKPFSQKVIEEVLVPIEKAEIDEYTEFEPCLKIAETTDFHAVIYWRGKLMQYDYLLCTFDKHGSLISRKSIAGTRSKAKAIIRSVATIDTDWIIHIMTGSQPNNATNYDPTNSQASSMEILATGDIIFSLQD